MSSSKSGNEALDRIEKDIAAIRAQLSDISAERRIWAAKDHTDPFRQGELAELKKKEADLNTKLAALEARRDALVEATPVVSREEVPKVTMRERGEKMTFLINKGMSDSYVGTGFFVTPTEAVTAKHVLDLIPVTVGGFVSCMFISDDTAPIRFHLAINYVSTDAHLDFAVLRLPTPDELKAIPGLCRLTSSPCYLPIANPVMGMAYTLAMHPSLNASTVGIYVNNADIARVADGGAYCVTDLYRGDSGCPLVQNMSVVGIFLGPRTGTCNEIQSPTNYIEERVRTTTLGDSSSDSEMFDNPQMLRMNKSSSDNEATYDHQVQKTKKLKSELRKLRSRVQIGHDALDSISQNTSELSVNKSKHNFFLSFKNVIGFLRGNPHPS